MDPKTDDKKMKLAEDTLNVLINEFEPIDQRDFLTYLEEQIRKHYESTLANREKDHAIAIERLEVFLNSTKQ